jgi:catechol 2,3-dioxygenase-like lactoylglutathione lyase family enzyme
MTMPQPAALHHTCFLVNDLEAATQRLADSLGIGPWHLFTIEPTRSEVRGVESPFSFRVALCTVGGGTFELVAPHSGRSVYDEHLERHGPGFHHTCLTYASLAELQAAKARLLAGGREMIQGASRGAAFEFGYFAFPEIGSAIELLFLDPAQLPPPYAVLHPRRPETEELT